MLRNIHLFNLKPGIDAAKTLAVIDGELADYARALGCIERKTWELLDNHPDDTSQAMYLNEALWPDLQAANSFGAAFSQDQSERAMRIRSALDSVTIVQTVRYVDDAG